MKTVFWRRNKNQILLPIIAAFVMFCAPFTNAEVVTSELTVLTEEQASIEYSRGRYNRRTGHISYTATLVNTGSEELPGPFYLEIADISVASVTVVEPSDVTDTGNAVLINETAALASGDSIEFVVTFSGRDRITYSSNLYNEDSDSDGDGVDDDEDSDRDGDGVDNELDDFPDDPNRSSVDVELSISAPANGFVTTSPQIAVSGQFTGPITSLRVDDVDAVLDEGQFTATLALNEGSNRVTAVGTYMTLNGEKAITATTTIVLDTTAPSIILTSIREGMVTTESQITIAGSLDDIRSSLSGSQESRVLVNGTEVEVINRAFELPDFLLQPGLNSINVVATDAVGNSSIERVTVNFLANAGQKLVEVQGNNQRSSAGLTLDEPLVVKLVDRNNVPIVDRAVTFKVVAGDGEVTDLPRAGRELTVISNEQGFAQVNFQLGNRAGAGLHQVEATSIGFPGQIVFCASAEALTPATISASRGYYQRSLAGSLLPEPLVTKVVDSEANPVQGVGVMFTVESGDGVLINDSGAESTQLIKTTDADGNVAVDFKLGNSPDFLGTNAHNVKASVVGHPELSTTFSATSFIAGAIDQTSVTGVVLDNSNIPLPGVEVSLTGESFAIIRTTTDEQGQFVFNQAPVGTVHVNFDASTTSAVGDFPRLSFEIVTVSGRENTVGLPVYIPRLDTQGGKLAGGSQQVVIPLAGVDGAEVIIAPNSVTLPDGRREGTIMFSQVQNDKTPMPAPDGVSFDVAWTLQPSGTLFDPPARVSLPNTSGGIPGQEYDMVTFDHDLGEWVSMGPGVVSEDGATITSKPGFGIREAGWGGLCPPPDDTCNIDCDDGNECTSDSKQDCFCENEIIEGKQDPNQEDFDCKTAFCDGSSEDDDSDFDASLDAENDCKMPGCENGTPTDLPDDQDISEEDLVCNKCQEGRIVPDENKEDMSCSDKPGEECLVCTNGACQPDQCEADSTTVSVGITNLNYVVNAIDSLVNLADRIPVFNLDMKPFFDVDGKRGMRCCKDCSNFDPEGVPYTEFKGSAGAKGKGEATIPGLGAAMESDPRTVFPGVSVAYEYFVSAVGLTVNVNLAGTVNALLIPDCEDEDCSSFRAGTEISGSLGPTVRGKFEVVACSASNNECLRNPPVLFGVEVKALAGLSAKGFVGVQAVSGPQCGRGCVGGRVEEIKLTATASGTVEFLFKKAEVEVGIDQVLFEGAQLGTPGCG
ncbi:carboxypeptidase regulatory-like domain-containing protein [Alteromonadaceae bacterium M269]|nr:carboxypeptidase regulatory-like domain-containing protein [Alteromonadaceae bacterium M269]